MIFISTLVYREAIGVALNKIDLATKNDHDRFAIKMLLCIFTCMLIEIYPY